MSSFSLVSSSWLNNLFDFCNEIKNENKYFFKYPNTKRNIMHREALKTFIEDNFRELFLNTYDTIYEAPFTKDNIHIKIYLIAVIITFQHSENEEMFITQMKRYIKHYFSYYVYNPHNLYMKGEKLFYLTYYI